MVPRYQCTIFGKSLQPVRMNLSAQKLVVIRQLKLLNIPCLPRERGALSEGPLRCRRCHFLLWRRTVQGFLYHSVRIIRPLLIIRLRTTTADNLFVPLLEQLSENMGLS